MNRGQLALEITHRKRPDAVDFGAAIKAEFRRDQALAREKGAYAVLKKNVAALGIDLDGGERPRLLSINGVRFRP